MKARVQFLIVSSCSLLLISGCWQPISLNTVTPLQASAQPTPTPQPQASATPLAVPSVLRLLTSDQLRLKVGEELMLVGEVEMSNRERLSFDVVQTQLKIENHTPDLLKLNLMHRTITALKPGIAEIHIAPLSYPQAGITIKVIIEETPPSAIDLNNVAQIELEIE